MYGVRRDIICFLNDQLWLEMVTSGSNIWKHYLKLWVFRQTNWLQDQQDQPDNWGGFIIKCSIRQYLYLHKNLQSSELWLSLIYSMDTSPELCTESTSNTQKFHMCTFCSNIGIYSQGMSSAWKSWIMWSSSALNPWLSKASWDGWITSSEWMATICFSSYFSTVLESRKRPWGWTHKHYKDAVKEIHHHCDI